MEEEPREPGLRRFPAAANGAQGDSKFTSHSGGVWKSSGVVVSEVQGAAEGVQRACHESDVGNLSLGRGV